MKYRIELDGLRSLAVIAVIFYHANLVIGGFHLLPGGLYGVDIFFVLSGFLITSIMKHSFEAGSFNLWDFYVRRAKRIIPALLFMLSISLLFAYLILLPEQLTRYAESLRASLVFLSNHYFLNEDSYTAPNSVFKPLLHTWSLAVEWQFYVVFPFVFYVLHRFSKQYILPCLLILTLISFQVSTLWVVNHSDSAFYLLPTRAWELLLGGLLCYIPRQTLLDKTPDLAKQVLPVFALYLICYSFFLFDHTTTHPSWPTLLPVIGTALLIVFANEKDLITKILSMKLPVYIGLISYSLYLWHQPIFAFYRVIKNKIPLLPEQFLLLFSLSVFFAIVSERFFERPFRKKINRKKVWLLCVLFLGTLLTSHWIVNKQGEINRPFMLNALNGIGSENYFKLDGRPCMNREANDACQLEPKKGNKTVVLLGDSHSGRLGEAVYNYSRSNDLGFIEYSSPACIGILGAYRHARVDRPQWVIEQDEKCQRNVPIYNSNIENMAPSIILYSIRMDTLNKFNRDFLPLIQIKIKYWEELGHSVVVVYDNPRARGHIPNMIASQVSSKFDKQQAFEVLDLSTSLEQHFKLMNHAYSFFDSIEGIERAYAYKALCSEETGRCISHSKDEIYYTDNTHLSRQGAKLVFDTQIKPVLDKVLE